MYKAEATCNAAFSYKHRVESRKRERKRERERERENEREKQMQQHTIDNSAYGILKKLSLC